MSSSWLKILQCPPSTSPYDSRHPVVFLTKLNFCSRFLESSGNALRSSTQTSTPPSASSPKTPSSHSPTGFLAEVRNQFARNVCCSEASTKDRRDSDFQSFILGGCFDAFLLFTSSIWYPLIWVNLSFSGAVLAMSVKTSSRSAVLAYNAGAANSNDFVAVEVRVADNYLVVEAEAVMTWAIMTTSSYSD